MDGTISEMKYPDAKPFAFEDGIRYEQFIAKKYKFLTKGKELHFFIGKNEQIKGETKERYEIKFDGRMKNTGNVYIEIAEKSLASNKNFVPSGIYRTDNTKWYWIGDYKQAFIFDKQILQKKEREFKHTEMATSKGFLIPIEMAKKICLRYLLF